MLGAGGDGTPAPVAAGLQSLPQLHPFSPPVEGVVCPGFEPPMIEVQQLTKDYGTVVAVEDLSFEVGAGDVVGFLGPNGAGKSTTLRILAGFLGPTSGTVRVAGYDVVTRSLAARRRLGYMPESSPLYPELRVREYLAFRTALKRVPRRQRKAAIDRAMELARVTDVAETLVGHLSRGYRQRVGLADVLVANPPLLILDEPTAGLDPNQIREVRALIREIGQEHTVLLSTHILSEVETTCDRAIVIHRGRLVAEGTIDELRAERQGRGARLVLHDEGDRAKALLEGFANEVRVAALGEDRWLAELRFTDAPLEDALERVVATLVQEGVGVQEVSPTEASLEEVFAQLTASSPGSTAASTSGSTAEVEEKDE